MKYPDANAPSALLQLNSSAKEDKNVAQKIRHLLRVVVLHNHII